MFTYIDRPLYFLHIPKTAGTSVAIWLKGMYDPSETLDIYAPDERSLVNSLVQNHHRLVCGHLGWEPMARWPGRFAAITFLREPIALAVSEVNFAAAVGSKAEPGNRLRELTESLSVDDVLQNEEFLLGGVNSQIRHLAVDEASVIHQTNIHASHKSIALDRLMSLPFFGLAEDCISSAALFAHTFNTPFRNIAVHANKTARARLPSAAATAAVTDACRLDSALYKEAQSVFDERLAAMRGRLDVDKSAPTADLARALNAAFCRTKAPTQTVIEGMCESGDLPMSGFHPTYYTPPAGRRTTWSGPDLTSTVFAPLRSGCDHTVRFELIYQLGERSHSELSLSVAGEGLALDRIWLSHGRQLISATIPCALVNPDHGFTAIDFAAPDSHPLAGVDFGSSQFNQATFCLGRVGVGVALRSFEESEAAPL